MPDSLRVGVATDDDLPVLLDAFGRRHFLVDRLRRARRGRGELLVAWRNREPVGHVYLWCEPAEEPEVARYLPGVPMLNSLEVVPGRRREGTGTALVRAAEAAALRRGYDRICLGVGVDNPGARRLYERLGYREWPHEQVTAEWTEPGPDGRPVGCRLVCHILVAKLTPNLSAWQSWHPEQVAERLHGLPAPWYVAAGWALDLWQGRQTREHSDVEIAIPRMALPRLRPYLADLALFGAGDGQVYPLGRTGRPRPGHDQCWVLDTGPRCWRMEVFLVAGGGRAWVSHRHPAIRRPYPEAVGTTPDGIPYLRPEVVLFVKARRMRDKDRGDFERVAPLLDAPARRWLAGALARVYPDHPWHGRLTGLSRD